MDGSLSFFAGCVWFALILAVEVVRIRRYGAYAKPEFFKHADGWGYLPFIQLERKLTDAGMAWYHAQRRYYARAFVLLLLVGAILDWCF